MTFPVTGVLDNFNRADEGPPPGSNWAGPVVSGESGLSVATNQLRGSGDANSSAHWSAATFGPDSECYITVATKDNHESPHVLVRLASPGTSGVDGYSARILVSGSTDRWAIFRLDNGVFTQIGAYHEQEASNGDKLGLEAIGSTLACYRHNGSSWSQLFTRTDSTYGSAGYIGVRIETTNNTRLDDFGGGTITAGGAALAERGIGRGVLRGIGRGI